MESIGRAAIAGSTGNNQCQPFALSKKRIVMLIALKHDVNNLAVIENDPIP